MKTRVQILVALGVLLSAAACDQDKSSTTTQSVTKTAGNGTTTEIKSRSTTETSAGSGKTTETTTIETKTTGSRAAPAASDIGVPECDAYILKMSACTSKMEPKIAASEVESLAASRKAWREAASTPLGRTPVATACRNALGAARTRYAALGCGL